MQCHTHRCSAGQNEYQGRLWWTSEGRSNLYGSRPAEWLLSLQLSLPAKQTDANLQFIWFIKSKVQSHLGYSEKASDTVWALGKNGWVSWCQENSYSSSSEWLVKAGRTSSHLLVGHYKGRPIISQPQCGRCHRAGTGQTTLEVIGSKWSYTLKWCKPNNDEHDEVQLLYLSTETVGKAEAAEHNSKA